MKKHSINDPWEALVLSILSVNGYPIEKTYSISDNLRKNGFFNPNKLAHYDFIDITRRIDSAGYKRGPFMTGLFSERLLALGKFAREQGIEFCTEIISGDNASKIEKFLLQVNGIGPKVLSNYFSLRGIQKH
jgi:3-methyladenine DNA glycosylase/8-oxoguanine DNA glycosylase